ncbi:MAG: restriction endonuclease subunit S [Methylococcaceae bacterium]|nr:restriction endonuclease subunit S [Methylococcaceae bacterium]
MQASSLKEISEFIKTGKTPPTKETKYFNGDVQWYTPGDLDKDKCLSQSNRSLTQHSFIDKKAVQFPAGTLLIACIGDIGKLGITTQECSSNQQITGIKPNKNTDVNYLYYWFRYNKNLIQHFSNNAVVPIINNGTLEKIKIPLPPLPEQQKIAAILDAADKLRQKDQQLIEKYTALSQSLFLDMFGDIKHNHNSFKVTTIGKVISEIKDGPHVSPKYSDEGIPILSTRNIRPFILILNELKFVSTEMYETLTKRFSPRKGDVLLTKGGTTGYAKVVDFDWKFCIWVHIAALRPKADLISAKYLEAALNSHYCYHQSQLLTKGIANKDLGLKRIVNIVLLLPPIALQNQFAERIQAIETQKQQAQASLQKSEDLFNSLLQRAFKGELTA